MKLNIFLYRFKDGKEIGEYRGPRTLDALTRFVTDTVAKATQ
jgi:hypothetical protein